MTAKSNPSPTKVADLANYQRWLRAADHPWPKTVTVAGATVEKVHLPSITGDALVLDFVGEDFRLPLSKGQAFDMIKATGTDVFADWVGKSITLTVATGSVTLTAATRPEGAPIFITEGEPCPR